MHSFPYNTLNAYYRRLFGKKTAKISLDAGFSCPNRDGTSGFDGCIFCSPRGAGDFAEDAAFSISAQIENGREQTAKKWPDACYIAYFQAFTNTHAPVDILRKKYEEALASPHICGLSIATRPDCLGAEVLSLLEEISEKTTLWVELGLQTAHEETAKEIGRGYENAIFLEAVSALNRLHIPIVVHLILGLPHESSEMVLSTIDFINGLPIQGVKLHLLHVLQGTKLASLYERGEYTPLTKEAYLQLLCRCIGRLRPDIVIHRLTGDGARDLLLAPLWSLNKRDVLNSLHKRLKEKNIHQGMDY